MRPQLVCHPRDEGRVVANHCLETEGMITGRDKGASVDSFLVFRGYEIGGLRAVGAGRWGRVVSIM